MRSNGTPYVRKRLLIVCLLLVSSGGLYVGYHNVGYRKVPEPVPSTSDSYHESYIAAAAASQNVLLAARKSIGAPSLSAAVAVDGKLVWAGSVGWANVEQSEAATPLTRYRIGSTSKSITATVAARLVDQGILNIDLPISDYLTNIPNVEWSNITSRQLMSHTAGLPGYAENRDLAGGFQTLTLQRFYGDVQESLGVFDGTDLLYEPGTDFHYSSFDVNLMSAVLQDAVDTPFPVLVRKEVSSVLGLYNTQADKLPGAGDSQAQFYEMNDKGIKPWRYIDLSLKWASGGYISTPSDLVQLGSAWLDSGYISQATQEMFWTPQTIASGEVNEQNYAIGFRSDDTEIDNRKYRRRHHGGVSKGAMNWLVIYPDLSIVVNLSMNTRIEIFSEFSKYEKDITHIFLATMEERR
jgi:CubicO group peptidase (beta-lactamase class C family)